MREKIEAMQRAAAALGEELLGRPVVSFVSFEAAAAEDESGISSPARAPVSDTGENGAAPLSPANTEDQ
jgi:hypothetical protein